MSHAGTAGTIATFYDRWASLYTALSRHAPGVGRMRRRAVEHLALRPGATALDMGCGGGVNFPYLREAVGPSGSVVGLDVAPRMLQRARREDPAAQLVLGDASDPPLRGDVDGILATFVITLFADPDPIIDAWWDLLAPGGRLALVNLGPMGGPASGLTNAGLEVGLRLWTPDDERFEDMIGLLDDRVTAAHGALVDRAETVHYHDGVDGLVRVVVGEKAPDR